MSRTIGAGLLIALTMLLTGCVTATVQQVREAATGMNDGE